jgi:hypothetical protein
VHVCARVGAEGGNLALGVPLAVSECLANLREARHSPIPCPAVPAPAAGLLQELLQKTAVGPRISLG